MSTLQVRAFEARDLSAVAALESRCNPAPWSVDALRPFAEGSSGASLVAESGGNVVGYVIVSRAADEAEILQLGVAPRARRQGIAGTLSRELLNRLRASGTRSIYLEVRRGNAPARALYASLGFSETGLRKGYYEDGEDAVLYRREVG